MYVFFVVFIQNFLFFLLPESGERTERILCGVKISMDRQSTLGLFRVFSKTIVCVCVDGLFFCLCSMDDSLCLFFPLLPRILFIAPVLRWTSFFIVVASVVISLLLIITIQRVNTNHHQSPFNHHSSSSEPFPLSYVISRLTKSEAKNCSMFSNTRSNRLVKFSLLHLLPE